MHTFSCLAIFSLTMECGKQQVAIFFISAGNTSTKQKYFTAIINRAIKVIGLKGAYFYYVYCNFIFISALTNN